MLKLKDKVKYKDGVVVWVVTEKTSEVCILSCETRRLPSVQLKHQEIKSLFEKQLLIQIKE